jgi:hypothetical protein
MKVQPAIVGNGVEDMKRFEPASTLKTEGLLCRFRAPVGEKISSVYGIISLVVLGPKC